MKILEIITIVKQKLMSLLKVEIKEYLPLVILILLK